jgi:O-antigen/teichoic acid export membrane protein
VVNVALPPRLLFLVNQLKLRSARVHFSTFLGKSLPVLYRPTIYLTQVIGTFKPMNRLRRVVGNTIISLLGQGVTWTSTLLLTIAYGRFLGDVRFGELYFAITFVALIGFPIESGFNQQLTREVAQEPARALRYLANILFIKACFWLALYGSILLVCRLLGYSIEVRVLVEICGITLLSGSIANTFSALHYAFERVLFPTVGTILEKGLTALIGILALRQGASVQVMAYILLGGSLTSACWQAVWAFRLLGMRLSVDWALIRDLLRTSIPFLVYGVLGVIYYRIDTILLSFLASTAVVGWYGASYRIFDTLVFLPSLVISAVMYPVFSKLSARALPELKIAVEKSMNFLLFCGIPITTSLIVAAPDIIGFLYHRPEFVHSVPALQALAPGLLFLYVNSVLSSIILSTKREKKISIMAAIALIFNLGLNLILIPRYQHIGAAIVTSVTELLLMGLAIAFVPRSLFPLGSLRVGIKALVASLVMALTMWMTHGLGLVLTLSVAAAVYLTTATLLGTIPRDDMKALYASMRNKKRSPETLSGESQVKRSQAEEPFLPGGGWGKLPDTEGSIGWRSAWTDPAIIAVGREIRSLPHTEVDMDGDTVPLQALRPSLNPTVSPTGLEGGMQQDGADMDEDTPTMPVTRSLRPGELPPVSSLPLPRHEGNATEADEEIL